MILKLLAHFASIGEPIYRDQCTSVLILKIIYEGSERHKVIFHECFFGKWCFSQMSLARIFISLTILNQSISLTFQMLITGSLGN